MRGKIIGKLHVMFFVSAVIFAVVGGISLAAFGDKSNAAAYEQIVFSEESGCYDSEFQLSLSAPRGGDIYYTLDGSVPIP
ncbi:MAG: hypothetical protein HFH14_03990, partial [Lachnospiraceae bacterium]|nr:hypothetical protein [Lachnospiraceae bacterium]